MGSLDKIIENVLFFIFLVFFTFAGGAVSVGEYGIAIICYGIAFVLGIQCNLDRIIFIEDEEE